MARENATATDASVTKSGSSERASGIIAKLKLWGVPGRHGERGSWLTEQYLFSRFSWLKLFRRTGWEIKACRPARLFYTGYEILNEQLPLETRRRLSRVLGSSCLIYILRKP